MSSSRCYTGMQLSARTASNMSRQLGPDENGARSISFEEVHTVEQSIMRHYSTANDRYAHFAVERLSTSVQAVCNVEDHLDDGQSILTGEDERGVVSHYVQQLDELASCLRQLVGYWEVYIESNSDVACRAPLIRLPRRGRPASGI